MIAIEICTNSIQSACFAHEGGVRRVELCHNLNEGGTTPSHGAIASCIQHLGLETRVLIRPRGGDFVYTDAEYEVIRRDVEQCKALGAAAVVVGFLNSDGTINTHRTAEIVRLAAPMEVTFHRAFDEVADPFAALEQVIDCGCHKLLTSGCKPTALEGVETLRQLVAQARGRIGIIAASGVNPANAAEIILHSGVREVHGSCKRNRVVTVKGNETNREQCQYSPDIVVETDPDLVRQLVASVQHL